MRKSRTPGSVRGVSGNGYPYRDIMHSQNLLHMEMIWQLFMM